MRIEAHGPNDGYYGSTITSAQRIRRQYDTIYFVSMSSSVLWVFKTSAERRRTAYKLPQSDDFARRISYRLLHLGVWQGASSGPAGNIYQF